jgi:hypothetical protein
MNVTRPMAAAVVVVLAVLRVAGADGGPQAFPDTQALTQFQRAADAYAFQHRQVERRAGGADPASVTTALRAARATAVEGALFTAEAGAAFIQRIRRATSRAGCAAGAADAGAEVPPVNGSASNTQPLDACIAAGLPPLPPELEYRRAATALLLVDAHNDIVVDVLRGALPAGP